jgi:isocitrate dehydrogenase (NAD+)
MEKQGGYQITLIPGDGIGAAVTGVAIEVISAAGVNVTCDRQLAGIAAVNAVGDPIPEELIHLEHRTYPGHHQ